MDTSISTTSNIIAWLNKCPRRRHAKLTVTAAAKLDVIIATWLANHTVSASPTPSPLIIHNQRRHARAWVHDSAACLGLVSTSGPHGDSADGRDITIAMHVQRDEDHEDDNSTTPRTRIRWPFNPVTTPPMQQHDFDMLKQKGTCTSAQQRAKRRETEEMKRKEYRSNCAECGQTLTWDTALFSFEYGGPCCRTCTRDPALEISEITRDVGDIAWMNMSKKMLVEVQNARESGRSEVKNVDLE